MDYFSDLPPIMEPPAETTIPMWDCRWPDPVALQVSAERILRDLPMDDPAINRRLPITINMEIPTQPQTDTTLMTIKALMVTPWAVERIFWHHPHTGQPPPIQYAISLATDALGYVTPGQGVLLTVDEHRLVPVVIAREPETGHYFVETLLHHTQEYHTAHAALAAALGEPPPTPPTLSMASTLHRQVSRRNMLGFWRRKQ